jgi:hypothetical protein
MMPFHFLLLPCIGVIDYVGAYTKEAWWSVAGVGTVSRISILQSLGVALSRAKGWRSGLRFRCSYQGTRAETFNSIRSHHHMLYTIWLSRY